MTKLRALSRTGSVTCRLALPMTTKNRNPTRMPPPAATTKSRARVDQATVATIAVRRATRAVASLSSDSPSRIVTILRGRPIRRAIAVAATASGGATTAPIAKQGPQPRSGSSQCTSTATPAVVKATSPTDSRRIEPPVGVEVDEARLDRRGVEQWRQQPEQHDFRAQLDVGHERQERADDADRDEHEWRGQVELLADRGHDHHGDDHADEREDQSHAGHHAPRWLAPGSARRARDGCRGG